MSAELRGGVARGERREKSERRLRRGGSWREGSGRRGKGGDPVGILPSTSGTWSLVWMRTPWDRPKSCLRETDEFSLVKATRSVKGTLVLWDPGPRVLATHPIRGPAFWSWKKEIPMVVATVYCADKAVFLFYCYAALDFTYLDALFCRTIVVLPIYEL